MHFLSHLFRHGNITLLFVAILLIVNAAFAENAKLDKKLIKASEKGKKEQVIELLANGANPNFSDKEGLTSLHYALTNGKSEIVDILLHRGAKITSGCLVAAAFLADTSSASVLIKYGADVSEDSGRAYTTAITQGFLINISNKYKAASYYRFAHWLIKNGFNINMRLFNGYTPLTYITKFMPNVENIRNDIVQTLISKGVDLNAKTTDGISALAFAKDKNDTSLVSILMAAGATE